MPCSVKGVLKTRFLPNSSVRPIVHRLFHQLIMSHDQQERKVDLQDTAKGYIFAEHDRPGIGSECRTAISLIVDATDEDREWGREEGGWFDGMEM